MPTNSLKFENNAVGQLNAGIDTVATSFDVQAGEGANFPTANGTTTMLLLVLVNSAGQREIVSVKRATDTFTVIDPDLQTGAASVNGRGLEGTIALTLVANDRVELRLTAGTVQNFEADIDSAEGDIDAIEADYLTAAAHVDSDDHSAEYSLTSEIWERSELAADTPAPIHAANLTDLTEIDHSDLTDDEDVKHRLISDAEGILSTPGALTVDGFTFGTGVVEFSGEPDLSGVTTDMELWVFTNQSGVWVNLKYVIDAVDDETDHITITDPPATMANGTTCYVVDPLVVYSAAKIEQRVITRLGDHVHDGVITLGSGDGGLVAEGTREITYAAGYTTQSKWYVYVPSSFIEVRAYAFYKSSDGKARLLMNGVVVLEAGYNGGVYGFDYLGSYTGSGFSLGWMWVEMQLKNSGHNAYGYPGNGSVVIRYRGPSIAD